MCSCGVHLKRRKKKGMRMESLKKKMRMNNPASHIIASLSFFLLDYIILYFTSVGSCKTFYLIHDN